MNFHEIVANSSIIGIIKTLTREPEGIADRGIYRF